MSGWCKLSSCTKVFLPRCGVYSRAEFIDFASIAFNLINTLTICVHDVEGERSLGNRSTEQGLGHRRRKRKGPE